MEILCFFLISFLLSVYFPSIFPGFLPLFPLPTLTSFHSTIPPSILPSILQTLTQDLPCIKETELNKIVMAPSLSIFTISAQQAEGSNQSQKFEITCDMECTHRLGLPLLCQKLGGCKNSLLQEHQAVLQSSQWKKLV